MRELSLEELELIVGMGDTTGEIRPSTIVTVPVTGHAPNNPTPPSTIFFPPTGPSTPEPEPPPPPPTCETTLSAQDRVDQSELKLHEGKSNPANQPSANSGATFGNGIDMKSKDVAWLNAVPGLSADAIKAMTPFAMVQPPDVPAAFTKYGHPTLSDSDMTALWNKAYPEHVATVSNYYNNATAANGFGVQLNQLPAAAQTVIIDMGYMHPNLPTWPNFWQQITTGNWAAAADNLRNWDGPGQTSQRKQDLANILQNAINAQQLPANAGSTKCN